MKSYSFILLFFIPFLVFAREERNLLTNAHTKSSLENVLVKGYKWVPYPDYADREGWQRLPEAAKRKFVKAGEKYLGYAWPTVRATEYLEFSRTGDRTSMERPQGERMLALRSLTMAELSEGKGRFMDDLINGVFSFCEQSYWGLSACFYMYSRGKNGWNSELGETNLPDIDDPIIDLWVGETATDLAWIWYFFHAEFDKISPVISRRLRSELQNRVLLPFYERNDYWWITGWGKGWVNNWTPWCNYNVLTCIALLEDDPVKKTEAIYKTMTSVDLFFNNYSNQGGCDEGPAYWGLAGGKAFEYLMLLSHLSNGKISLFEHPLIKEIGKYICRTYICDGVYFTNFADASARIHPRAGVIYRYGEQIGDSEMIQFGTYLLSRSNSRNNPDITIAHGSHNPDISTLGPTLDECFLLKIKQPDRMSEPLFPTYYFSDLQVAIAREHAGSTKGFYFAAKGGNNGEGHGHNDVGSCIVFYDGNPVLVDVGVGTYTRETFSSERFKIWTMQSVSHNLPLINGVQQSPGGNFRAAHPEYKSSDAAVSFSADIAGAYPEEAKVEKWIRGYQLKRNKGLTISDKFQLKETNGKTELHFITPLEIRPVKPGLLELSGESFTLQMRYDASLLSFHSERITFRDPQLVNVWGDYLTMIVFDVAKKKSANNVIEIVRVNRAERPNDRYFDQSHIRSLMLKVTEWQLSHPKHALCDWTNGAFYAGVFAAWETTHDDKVYRALLDMGEQTRWQPCNTYAGDRANDLGICQTYVDLYRIEKKQEMIQPFIDTLNAFISRPYPTEGIKVQKWWWCDALFMEPPAIVKLGITLDNPEYLKYNDKHFKDCYRLLYDREEHLFARDLMYVIKGDGNDKRESNGKKIFWGRGNGWVLAGLARILKELPSDYAERPFYEKIFREMSVRLIAIQQPDGLWRCSLLDPDAYPGGEASSSGFFCYGLAWGINNGLLDKKTYLPAVEKAWVALNGCVNEEGRVGWVQPIGDNPLKNFSKDSWEVYGTGAFLLAASEISQLKR